MAAKVNPSNRRLGTRTSLGLRTAYQLLRVVPGTRDFRRDLRDAAWLSEADATVISFPKSGRTYLRAMLARLYQRKFGVDERDLLDFARLRHLSSPVPRLLFTHAGDAMRRPDEIRVDPSTYSRAPIVLLARHPGDIAVSRYHHLKHRSSNRARRRLAEQPLEDFVWTDHGGIPSIVTFLNGFAAMPDVTVIRYRDLVDDPAPSLHKIAATIGLNVDLDDILDAVDFGRLPNLRRLEQTGYFRSKRLRPADARDAQSGKVRKGTTGGYRTELPPSVAAAVDAYIADNLDPKLDLGTVLVNTAIGSTYAA